MKAIRIQENGTISLSDFLLPVLESAAVTVPVEACGLCTTDLDIREDRFWGSYSIIPGHEIAGVVERTGDLAHDVTVGDRVAVDPNIPCGTCSQCRV
ncbi:alcohol dehydrogenase catalytic domain-containing protein [Candidatus Bipolaricaulota bacterium]|nr:alcohol dehydrogenase catalytic domain-containing protein [Candidatus Bipolaricaulota bacterium]